MMSYKKFKSINKNPQRITKLDRKMALITLIMRMLNLLSLKQVMKRLNKKIIFALMYSFIKIVQLILFIYQNKSLKVMWIDCLLMMKTSHTMSVSKILTNFSSIRQNIKIKNTFADIVNNVLVVKKFWQNINKILQKKTKNRL